MSASPPPSAEEEEPDEFYVDVDVSLGEDTAGEGWGASPELAALAAELEASCPALMQAVLDCASAPSDALALPAPLRALQRYAVGAELSVLLCGDAEIEALNAQYRGVEEATDVLSFPLLDPDAGDAPGAFLFPNGHAALGDVVVSLSTAARQAAERGVRLEEEVQALLVHGLLHLLGFDHELGEQQAQAMERMEGRVLRQLGWGGVGLIQRVRVGGVGGDEPGAPPSASSSSPAPAAAAGRPRRTLFSGPAYDLLFVDLDGTLLDSRGRVSPAVASALRAVSQAGTSVVVATGKARPAAMAALSGAFASHAISYVSHPFPAQHPASPPAPPRCTRPCARCCTRAYS